MMINEYGPVGGMRIDKRNLPQCHFFATKIHKILSE
jgi:hypothetical protein